MTTFASASTAVQNAVYNAAANFGIDPAWLFAIGNNETGLNGTNPPTGGAGEIGTFQILPSTATSLGYSLDPNSPNYVGTLQNNANAAAKLLSQLEESSNGNESTMFAQYNQGAGSIAQNGIAPSTQTYVQNALAGVLNYGGGASLSPTASESGGSLSSSFSSTPTTSSSTGTPGTGNTLQDFINGFLLSGSNSGSGQPTGGAASLQQQTVKQDAPWFQFLTDAITQIETDALLGGLALALVAGGFALLAADNKNVRTVVSKTAEGLAA